MPVAELNFSILKLLPKTLIIIMPGEVSHYYDVVLISVVVFIDKQSNDNDLLLFPIKLFWKDGNDVKLYKQLTTIVHDDWNCNLFAIYLCGVVMKQANTLFIYLNPKKDDSTEDIKIQLQNYFLILIVL